MKYSTHPIESAVCNVLAGTPFQQIGPVDEGGGIQIVVGGGASFAEDMQRAKEKLTAAGLDAFPIGVALHVKWPDPPQPSAWEMAQAMIEEAEEPCTS